MEVIKENIINFRGNGGPFTSTAYGYLRLTETTLVLDYYLLGIVGNNNVHGIMKRKIEIPIENIEDVGKQLDVLVISYKEGSETRKIYLGFWKTFKTGIYTLNLCDEWISEINKLR